MTGAAGDGPVRAMLDRIHAQLAGTPAEAAQGEVREVRMFGAVAVMVDGAMLVAVRRDGGLLVRVDRAAGARLLERPGVSQAQMGAGRSMGTGWLQLEAGAVRTEADLAAWLEHALARPAS